MNANKTTCLQLGGNRCIAVAKVQAAKPLERHPVASFGGMQQLCSLGNNRSVLVGRIGGVEPRSRQFC